MAVSVTIESRTAEKVLEDFSPYGSKEWRKELRRYLDSPSATASTSEFCADRPYQQLRRALLVDGDSRVDSGPFYGAILQAWYIEAWRRDQEKKIAWERRKALWPHALWKERERMFSSTAVQAVKTLHTAMPNEEAKRRFELIPVATYEVDPPEGNPREVPLYRFVIRMADILRGKPRAGQPSKGDDETVQDARMFLMDRLVHGLRLPVTSASEIVADVLRHFFPPSSKKPPIGETIRKDWNDRKEARSIEPDGTITRP